MSELQIGEYIIPDGCTIRRVGNTIQVYQKVKKKLDAGDYRCKDCKHYVDGHTGLHYWITKVCDMKPKTLSRLSERGKALHKDFKDFKLYYYTNGYEKPCDKFEARKEE